MSNAAHYSVLIVGGGAAGISVASRLARANRPGTSIAILDPSETHDYQPLWTLVGAGAVSRESTRRRQADLIPSGVEWIKDAAAAFEPDANTVLTRTGRRLTYDTLVVAAGIQIDWAKVKGLAGNVGKGGICSNYSYETVNSTWDAIRSFKGGDAVFTHPATPIKCGGAPQKIMYLADDAFRKQGVRDKAHIHFYSGEAAIFKVTKYADALMKVIERKGLETHFKHSLVEVRPDSREAVFQDMDKNTEVVQRYDMLHVTPPMSSPDFIKQSPLANAAGWVDVDKATCRSVKFKNIFGLGDCSSLPTSKTGAAIRKQAPVVAANVLAQLSTGADAALPGSYNGYTSCPLVTGYGKLILAEFDYDLKPQESFPFDQSKERLSMYLLKKHLLPVMYWKGMLKGKA